MTAKNTCDKKSHDPYESACRRRWEENVDGNASRVGILKGGVYAILR